MITAAMVAASYDGRVQVYEFATKSWVRKWPVDAQEMIRLGQASVSGPDKPEEKKPQAESSESAEPVASNERPDLNGMTVAELRKLATSLGVEGVETLKKAELVAAIEKTLES